MHNGTMTQSTWSWIAVLASVLLLGSYELLVWRAGRRNAGATARTAHRELRGQWVRTLSEQHGTELLAVQTLRNSLMSATINASTAALGLMGSISLMASRDAAMSSELTPALVVRILLAGTLFAAYVTSAFAMRYYHHAGFVMSLPVGSAARQTRIDQAAHYVSRAGILYSWSLRCFLFVAPIAGGVLTPLSMPFLTIGLLLVLTLFDRLPKPLTDGL
jgi:uncharacterized membrane protein